MSAARRALMAVILPFAVLALTAPAFADKLYVAPDAPLWMHVGAGALLWLHIGGGTAGLLSGWVAVFTRKGATLHRRAGAVFLVSMLVMAAIGGAIAPLLNDRISTVAGFMTFYLVATGALAARRREGYGTIERIGFAVALIGVVATYTLTWMAMHAPGGTLDGSPPQAFYLFAFVSTVAALFDLKLLLRGGVTGGERMARHVWRMCFALFVSSGSLFLGQMQVFPAWLRDTPVLYVLGLAPLPFLIFWVFRVRLVQKYRGNPARAAVAAA